MENVEWSVLSFEELSKMELYKIVQARIEVFVVEQDARYQDLDGKDFAAYHILGTIDGHLAAYARVYMKGERGSVGRLLVMKEDRRKGLARALFTKSIEALIERFEISEIIISAQTYLVDFYAEYGFEPRGEEYLDAELAHIDMVKSLL